MEFTTPVQSSTPGPDPTQVFDPTLRQNSFYLQSLGEKVFNPVKHKTRLESGPPVLDQTVNPCSLGVMIGWTDSRKHRKTCLAYSTSSGGFSVAVARVPSQGLDPKVLVDRSQTQTWFQGGAEPWQVTLILHSVLSHLGGVTPAPPFRRVRVSMPVPGAGVSVQTVIQFTG